MLKQVTIKPVPTDDPARPHAVNRAVADLRGGGAVLLRDGAQAALIEAAEMIDEAGLAHRMAWTGTVPSLVTTRRRAAALGLVSADTASAAPVELKPSGTITAALVAELADPTLPRHVPGPAIMVGDASRHGLAAAAIELAKLAWLLPAMVFYAIDAGKAADLVRRHDIIELDVATLFDRHGAHPPALRRVTDAQVPLADAENTRIVAFRPEDGGLEHLAIVVGDPRGPEPVLARLHSECFTGDRLGSLRCDCGEQLRGAIKLFAESGGGVVIYLAQEGRGIGLVNKLRAYRLQDSGFDTVDANEQLGFEADERVYQPAAEMLRQLGFDKVRLLTNNPDKVAGLAQQGIEVTRVPHAFAPNRHNRFYLDTKAARSGHQF
jgi:GTP cyclohydrolase II